MTKRNLMIPSLFYLSCLLSAPFSLMSDAQAKVSAQIAPYASSLLEAPSLPPKFTARGFQLPASTPTHQFLAYLNGKAGHLFFSTASTDLAGAQILIQRVMKTLTCESASPGTPPSSRTEYLVEAFKVLNGQMKRADAHWGLFDQGGCKRRVITKKAEVGIATIPGRIAGTAWPFSPTVLYSLIQEYQENPGLYSQVQFSDSVTWDYSVTLSATEGVGVKSSLGLNQQSRP